MGLTSSALEPTDPAISVLDKAQSANATLEAHSDVSELLTSASIPLSSIDAIIWSNHHMPQIGDASLFPPMTPLIVGPGFKTNPSTYPGFPLNPDSHVAHAAFEGRDVIELDFNRPTGVLKIGGLRAIDWFDDGSMYLLEAPGRAPENIMALARTSADKFVLLAGDTASHPALIRPSTLRPLPESITPSPLEPAPNSSSYDTALLARAYPRQHTRRTARRRSTNPRSTLCLIQSQAARRAMRYRLLMLARTYSSHWDTTRHSASLVPYPSRVGRSRVARMQLTVNTPYTGASYPISGRACSKQVVFRSVRSFRLVGL